MFAEEVGEAKQAGPVAAAPEEAVKNGGDDALGRAASRAGRRALAAQFTLFDSADQTILDEFRGVDVETLSAEEARELLLDLKKRMV